MDEKAHIWYVDVIIKVPVKLMIKAKTREEASSRALGGRWHGVQSSDYDKAVIIAISDEIVKGPGVN